MRNPPLSVSALARTPPQGRRVQSADPPRPRNLLATRARSTPKRHAGGDARTLRLRTARLPTALCTAAAHLKVGACLALDASPGCLEACCYLLSPAKDAQSGGHRLRPDWSTDARPLGLSHGRSQKRGRGGRGRSPEMSRDEPRDRRDHKRHPRGDQRVAGCATLSLSDFGCVACPSVAPLPFLPTAHAAICEHMPAPLRPAHGRFREVGCDAHSVLPFSSCRARRSSRAFPSRGRAREVLRVE